MCTVTILGHYKFLFSFDRTSGGVTIFSRDVGSNDLIQMAGGSPGDPLRYIKHEESVFVDKILKKSRGKMEIKLDFGDLQGESDDSPDDDVDRKFDFGKEFESNGSYLIQQTYCRRRTKRSATFPDLKASSVKKDALLAVIDLCKLSLCI